MHLVMFDIDGTLTLSNTVDSRCYYRAMSEVLGEEIDESWWGYQHVTDSGIAAELFARHGRTLQALPEAQARFFQLLDDALSADPSVCREVPGANAFLQRLRDTTGVTVGLATGGWGRSARKKLLHAGIDVDGLAFASADDAESRVEIMEFCRRRAGAGPFASITYLGDADWDVKASGELGWSFIGIDGGGHASKLRAAGATQIFDDYRDPDALLEALAV